MRILNKILLGCAFCFFVLNASSQTFTVTQSNTTNLTPSSLVNNVLVGTGISGITNINFTGSLEAIGRYDNSFPQGGEPFVHNSGLVLSTGKVTDIDTANTSEQSGKRFELAGDGDIASLLDLPVELTFDAAVLEFDFIPSESELSLEFIFGSEEYNEYVCSQYNDAFAFLVSGQNPNGSPYVKENIALIPGTSDIVSINSINNGMIGTEALNPDVTPIPSCISLNNTNLYRDNSNGNEIELDGITLPLASRLAVVPNTTYSVKIVIADVFDASLDAAVFLKFQGLKSGAPVNCPEPIIAFTGECTSGPSQFAFDSNIGLAGATIVWDFGDGTSGAGLTPTHQYTEAGSYTVQATIIGPDPGCYYVTETEVTINCCECRSSFAPMPGQKYVLTAWAKEDFPLTVGPPSNGGISIITTQKQVENFTGPRILLHFSNLSGTSISTVTIAPNGPMVEGWQQIKSTFVVPSDAVSMEIELQNIGTNEGVYFDDIRVHPFNSSMKTYVYDPESLRLWSELDDRNFATYYEYDEQGNLTRIKKETERGIVTIQESREGGYKETK